MDKHITAPITKEVARTLKAGDYVYITGTIYTARDAAHKRMYEILEKGEDLPIDIKEQIIYYMGPSPAREGRPIGSAGPTTASRMDKYAPQLLDLGQGAMIGKGKRSQAVCVCRQVLREFVDPNEFLVLLCKGDGSWNEMTLEELLPMGFGKENL